MGQRDRHDEPGKWHHVVNRGIARRSVFEGEGDVRYFLSRLARVHRQGLLEVHAFSFMLTHFHLLVRSPVGEMSRAMRGVTNLFVRRVNRGRKRDGPLFRGRFLSRPVESERYWWTLVRYIDFNPVKAGIVRNPVDYPFGSAVRYAQRGPRPKWLTRGRVEADVMGGDDCATYDPERYQEVFGDPPTDEESEFIERRLRHPCGGPDPLDDLIGAAPEGVQAWQRRKCALADGTRPGLPIVTAGTVLDLIGAATEVPAKARRVLAAGLLRLECGLALREIAERTDCAESTALRRVRKHSLALAEPGEHADVAARILAAALARDHAPKGRQRPTGAA